MTLLSVFFEDREKLSRQLRGLPDELRLEQRKQVSAAAAVVRDEVVRRIHSPAGKAKKGIKIYVSGSGINMRARIRPSNVQALFSQRSRGANTTPPPMKAARKMARLYHIPLAKARGIAVMIGRRGTRGHPVMVAALAAVRVRVEALYHDALLDVVRRVVRT
jgi:hypothetical protein